MLSTEIADIVPVFKNGDTTLINNYIHISVLLELFKDPRGPEIDVGVAVTSVAS